MPNQILRGLIFIILVFLLTSDLKEIISAITASSTVTSAFLQRPSAQASRSSHQRGKRHASHVVSEGSIKPPPDSEDVEKPFPTGGSLPFANDALEDSASDFNDKDSLDYQKRLNAKGQNMYAKKKYMKLNAEEKKELLAMKTQLTSVMQEWCLPKLVCELHASVSERGSLTEAEKGLLSLIRETSLGTMGEVVSRYHFAAHMGQLISGVEGNGCHNFYPNCPLSGNKVLQMMKKVRIR